MEDKDMAIAIAEEIVSALTKIAEQAREGDKSLLALIREVIVKMTEIDRRVEELELLTRIVTTPPQ